MDNLPQRTVRNRPQPFLWTGSHEVVKQIGEVAFASITDVGYFANPTDRTNMERAFRLRINPVTPISNPKLLHELAQYVDMFLLKQQNKGYLEPLPNLEQYDDELFEQWLENNHHYGLPRKQMFRRKRTIVKPHGRIIFQNRFTDVQSFIKLKMTEEAKYPRLVNSRSDYYKVIVAPYVKLIEDQVFKMKWFLSGIPTHKFPPYLEKLTNLPWIMETDYSSFEGCFTREYTKCVEEKLWKFFLVNNPEMLKYFMAPYEDLNGETHVNRIFGPNYTAFVEGSRMSGEMWTSLANGFSNLINVKFLAHKLNMKIHGYVMGDDGIFSMEKPILTKEHFAELGFNIKIKYDNSIAHTSFCGNIYSPESQTIIIEPGQISSLFTNMKKSYFNAKQSKKLQLLRNKAQSLYCIGKYTPIISKLALKIIDLIPQQNVKIVDYREKWLIEQQMQDTVETFDPVAIPYENRWIYANKYNISLQQQQEVEALIENVTKLEDLSLPNFKDKVNISNTINQ